MPDTLFGIDSSNYGRPETGVWPGDHRYSVDNDRCVCGGEVKDGGDSSGGCEVVGVAWSQ